MALWRPWVDHVRVYHLGYEFLANEARDPLVREKLLGPSASSGAPANARTLMHSTRPSSNPACQTTSFSRNSS